VAATRCGYKPSSLRVRETGASKAICATIAIRPTKMLGPNLENSSGLGKLRRAVEYWR
jgi:hypothetical protein